jgi:hypothetical protein
MGRPSTALRFQAMDPQESISPTRFRFGEQPDDVFDEMTGR